MIEIKSGNLLDADVEALVNTVNLVGVMGKGIALQFRMAFPANYEAYRRAYKRGELAPGRVHVFPTASFDGPKYILNFPTKRHWKEKARLEDIDAGLLSLVDVIREYGITSVAIPPLGCGNGGLNWEVIRPRIENALGNLEGVTVLLYSPAGAPRAEEIRVNTRRPNMTPGRAALIGLFRIYGEPGYLLTLLEVHKLGYFLENAGEPLRLNYTRGIYGPYSEVLNPVLQNIEGHYIRGYGDRTGNRRSSPIWLIPGAVEEADEVLRSKPDTHLRLEKVGRLIEGFETPYGMELLATVHWCATEDPEIAGDIMAVIEKVQAWSERKRQLFREEHITAAWQRLRDEGWI